MINERQLAANRRNALRSTGPATPEGRAASARNSLRHGLLADTVVLAGESAERFTDLLADLTHEFDPQTPTESSLVENMAISRWREMRLWSIERAGFEREIAAQSEATHSAKASLAFRSLGDQLERLNRYETRFDRQYCRALSRLLDLQSRRKKVNLPNEPNSQNGTPGETPEEAPEGTPEQ